MSLKVERDTVEKVTQVVDRASSAANTAVATLPRDVPAPTSLAGPLPGTSGKHPFAEAVGTVLTGGKKNAGTKGYLMVCDAEPSGFRARRRWEVLKLTP